MREISDDPSDPRLHLGVLRPLLIRERCRCARSQGQGTPPPVTAEIKNMPSAALIQNCENS